MAGIRHTVRARGERFGRRCGSRANRRHGSQIGSSAAAAAGNEPAYLPQGTARRTTWRAGPFPRGRTFYCSGMLSTTPKSLSGSSKALALPTTMITRPLGSRTCFAAACTSAGVMPWTVFRKVWK